MSRQQSTSPQKRPRTTHGMSYAPEFAAWRKAKDRCFNPRCPTYRLYGARGITVCDRWRESFEAFFADMGPRPSAKHSLDRINNDGPYSPENCRWATQRQQVLNQRNARLLTFNGETLPLSLWAERANLSRVLLSQRLCNGWDMARALSTPHKPYRKFCWCGRQHEGHGLCATHNQQRRRRTVSESH